MRKTIVICTLFLMVVLACDSSSVVTDVMTAFPLTPTPTKASDLPTQPVSDGSVQEIPMQVGYGARGSFYEIYFTDPLSPDADRQEGGPDAPLVQAIDKAQVSVDVAAYSISLRSVRDALLRAQKRGVQVRIVMESTNIKGAVPQALLDAGTPIIGDNRNGLMHDKFMVIDRSEVWAGSMNFTTSGTYEDNNNLIHILSTKVADDYTVEFEEMFKRNFFGSDVVAKTPNPHLIIDGISMEVYFSPDDKVAQRIVELLRGAQQSITFMAYSFTAGDFGKIISQKAKQGLKINGVMEQEQVKSNKGTEFTYFERAGLPVYKDGNPGQMHHKVFIIDEQIVITGSYNFSFSAETQNDENVMIFFDRQIAAEYLSEFARVESQAQK
jgi:phosphatidylserine/phosphatidylglycerophosphate/cardiolipin synthase-like enzyme